MPLQLLPLPESEWPIYVYLLTQSFKENLAKIMSLNSDPESGLQHLLGDFKRHEQRHPGRAQFMKVVDTDLPDSDPLNKIVGISQWKIFPQERSEEEMRKEEEDEQADHEKYGFPPGSNHEAVTEYFDVVGRYQRKHLGRGPYVFLSLLATREGQGRRGIGAMSMKYGVEVADKLGVPMYLEGSPDGVGLYKKWGYEVVDVLPFDGVKYGLTEPYTLLCMKRPARTDMIQSV